VSVRRRETVGQVARFGLVGVLNTIVDYVVFVTLMAAFGIPLSKAWVAKYPSSVVAMVVSFVLNRGFVFRSREGALTGQAFRFVTATVIGVFVIQNGLTLLFASAFQYPGTGVHRALDALGIAPTEKFTIETVAFALGTIASLTWNFLAYKYWAFRPSRAGRDPRSR
jgi:putative flippase GtrA